MYGNVGHILPPRLYAYINKIPYIYYVNIHAVFVWVQIVWWTVYLFYILHARIFGETSQRNQIYMSSMGKELY